MAQATLLVRFADVTVDLPTPDLSKLGGDDTEQPFHVTDSGHLVQQALQLKDGCFRARWLMNPQANATDDFCRHIDGLVPCV